MKRTKAPPIPPTDWGNDMASVGVIRLVERGTSTWRVHWEGRLLPDKFASRFDAVKWLAELALLDDRHSFERTQGK